MLYAQPEAAEDADGMRATGSALGRDAASEGDRWAAQQLSVDGEEVLGKVNLPQYLLLSRVLVTAPLGGHSQAYYGLLSLDVSIACCKLTGCVKETLM